MQYLKPCALFNNPEYSKPAITSERVSACKYFVLMLCFSVINSGYIKESPGYSWLYDRGSGKGGCPPEI